MNPSLTDTPALSRRGLLKFSLGASLFLSTVSLGACSPGHPGNGLAALRDSDLPFLRAVIPVMLEGAVSVEALPAATTATLQSLDTGLAHLSPATLRLARQLFDVLTLGITRGPLTGVWGEWENASADEIRHFLQRWENSSLDLLRQGHCSLLQMVMMAWYSRAEAWANCGYPGPPAV
ncbi:MULTISPECIES: twin-arginine translocation pathway signal protein [unclassified Pseudomonas]|uniref:twin-arginine translocation pathway signal protein n=1 Tax=unclassified Pseudomonas TaxID=196821 RepID=UPI00091ADC2C|nr:MULTISPECIES: twin-arginine translocation pathway signal protein [unclassified Pseudomonas]SFX41469.1 hypothetical protein SAMN03159352_01206 [Pseudomonas sp. NFACC43]SFX44917.1 hypothetical protein SAMN03159442_01701 [Pseudomonas sp. NFACC47-1]